eukprot:7524392-Pyramimonas_sp.AAC.1
MSIAARAEDQPWEHMGWEIATHVERGCELGPTHKGYLSRTPCSTSTTTTFLRAPAAESIQPS